MTTKERALIELATVKLAEATEHLEEALKLLGDDGDQSTHKPSQYDCSRLLSEVVLYSIDEKRTRTRVARITDYFATLGVSTTQQFLDWLDQSDSGSERLNRSALPFVRDVGSRTWEAFFEALQEAKIPFGYARTTSYSANPKEFLYRDS